MSIDKVTKIKQAIELDQAIKDGKGEFVLLKKLDNLDEKMETLEKKIGEIKPTDVSDVRGELKKIKQELEKELEIELNII